MENRSRYWTAAMMIALSGFAGKAESSKQSGVERTILLKVINPAGAPQEVLRGAEHQMAQVYRRFGVTVVWQYPEEVQQNGPAIEATDHYAVYYLRVLRREGAYKKELDQRVAGYASPGSRFVSAFYDRIQDESKSMDMPEQVILGYVVAHELGHTFLPANCHAPGGVMSASMEKDYWSKAQKGWLGFREVEIRQILTALKR
jgi:hypothetical protein